jgi:succinate dehydrogenase / fumarate reductase flavoprotein subunit
LYRPNINPAAEIVRLQRLMNEHVGPLRTREGLMTAIAELGQPCTEPAAPRAGFDAEWLDLHDLGNMRLVAECVARAALAREESRGAHQRAEFPRTEDAWQRHQTIRVVEGALRLAS